MAVVQSPISRETMIRLVEAATLAPSAENLQPWRFDIEDDSITVALDLSRQLPSDQGDMLGLTSIGACIENAVIAGSAEGLRAKVQLVADSFRNRSGEAIWPIARLALIDGGRHDLLAEYLASRCTSRRMEPRRVSEQVLHELGQSCADFSGVDVYWVRSEQLQEFAYLVGLGNRIRFEHRAFHQELFQSLRFSKEDAERTRDGLDVATLQLPWGAMSIMNSLRTWPRMKLANLFGFSRGVARQATQEVLRSGAVGILAVADAEAGRLVHGGRALERLWLTATRLGLCFHPTASLPVFLAHGRAGGRQLLPRHAGVVRNISERFSRLYPMLDGNVVQMAFRVGFGPKPPVRSLRKPSTAVATFGHRGQDQQHN